MPKVIDCLVNVHFGGEREQPGWMLEVRDKYFKGPQSMYRQVDLTELIDEMDEQGVEKAILMYSMVKPSPTALKFVEEMPERFVLAVNGGGPAASGVVAARTRRARARSAGRVHDGGAELLGATACIRPPTPCTPRCTTSAPNWACRCA